MVVYLKCVGITDSFKVRLKMSVKTLGSWSAHAHDHVFTDMFNISLTEFVIPKCFKQNSIVPVPKDTKLT